VCSSDLTPQDKLYIVNQCRMRGEIVAVTGDGVNDAPAMKQADIGVAMGLKGSEVAKEASDVVLMDDNFASIVVAIEEGRLVFDNLKKTIAYTLTHLLPEILPVILTLALGLPPGLSTLQILSIDLFTELAPAISLAYEPAEPDIMQRRPRNIKTDRLVSRQLLSYAYLQAGVLEAAACFLAYFFVYRAHDVSMSDLFLTDSEFGDDNDPFITGDGQFISVAEEEQIANEARAAWYITLVVGQLLHLINLKSTRASIFTSPTTWSNEVTYFALALSGALAVIFVYVPGKHSLAWVAPLCVRVRVCARVRVRACVHAIRARLRELWQSPASMWGFML
jgi:sodium/potassium-transporting ATPase subunit alpha